MRPLEVGAYAGIRRPIEPALEGVHGLRRLG